MVLAAVPDRKRLEGILRDSLGTHFSTYKDGFCVEGTRRTSHADINHLVLTRKGHPRKRSATAHFALKKFFPVIDSGDMRYSERHRPELLSTAEARFVRWLDRDVKIPSLKSETGNNKAYLGPQFYGHSVQHLAVASRFIHGEVLYDKLAASSGEEFGKCFLQGVRDVARLNGVINSPENQFYSSPEEFEHEAARNEEEKKEALVANLSRMYYALHPEEFRATEFSTELVVEHLKSKKSIDLKSRVEELTQKRANFNDPSRLQHRDCNGKNMIWTNNERYRNRFVDHETAGPDSGVEDIASYCIVLAHGNNHVFNLEDFPYFRYVFHAYEDAWRNLDLDLVEKLDGYHNGQFVDQVGRIMTEREDNESTMAFFANAVNKTLTLSAAGARSYKNDSEEVNPGLVAVTDPIAVTDPSRWRGDIDELFTSIHSMIPIIQGCGDSAKGIADYFHTFGHLFNDLGYKISETQLTNIRDLKRRDSFGEAILRHRPERYLKE